MKVAVCVLPLLKDYELKSQAIFDFEKKVKNTTEKNIKVAITLRLTTIYSSKKQEEQQYMNERKITTKGYPSLERLPKNEAKAFYSTLFSQAIEYFKEKNELKGGASLVKQRQN